MAARSSALLVGSKKGLFVVRLGPGRRSFTLQGPHFLGQVVNHAVADPRDGRTVLAAVRTGHLGPTVFRSTDRGRTWKEAATPPAFAKVAAAGPGGAAGSGAAAGGAAKRAGRAVENVFWLTPGPISEPGSWYAGTVPHGLFRTADGGVTWTEVAGFTALVESLRAKADWVIGDVPGGPITHSILVDPRDGRHLYVGLSTGGFFESRDAGGHWQPLNRGCEAYFLPVKDPEVGHDPHRVVLHPARPDRLWQANHCGTYRLDRPAERWERIGLKMPKSVGDIGFNMVLHPRDTDTAWVFPMDGTDVWPRTSPGGKPAVYQTTNAGRSWRRLDKGLPAQGWFTVLRQAFCADGGDPVGLYFGTTSGALWASRDEGRSWKQAAAHLPYILSVEAAAWR